MCVYIQALIDTSLISAFAIHNLPYSSNQEIPPKHISNYRMKIINFSTENQSQLTMAMVIDEHSGNELYDAAVVYLGSKIWPHIRLINVKKLESQKSISVTVEPNQEMIDSFDGAEFKWILVSPQIPNPTLNLQDSSSSARHFKLCFDKKREAFALDSYLPFVLQEAKKKKEAMKILKIFTVDEDKKFNWKSKNLDHPATLATFPMDVEMKESLKKDLDKFLQSREVCVKNGLPWKRRYLIPGPPRTGKSSLVAAMANFLNLDVYVLELRNLKSKWELKKLLMSTESPSILVLEDIDSTMLPTTEEEGSDSREADKVTVIDLMKLMDELWSSCGHESIIIYTTSDLKLKYALAALYFDGIDYRSELSYCTPSCFRFLAHNYFGLEDHPLFEEIEDLIPTAEMTPAKVAKHFFKSDRTASDFLFEFLFEVKRAIENQKTEAEDNPDEESSYCSEYMFRFMAKSRFGPKPDPLFKEIVKLIKSTKVTSGEIDKQLMKCDGLDESVAALIGFLKEKEKAGGKQMTGEERENCNVIVDIAEAEDEEKMERQGVEKKKEESEEVEVKESEKEDKGTRRSESVDEEVGKWDWDDKERQNSNYEASTSNNCKAGKTVFKGRDKRYYRRGR